jgi:hypothetical protein
MSRNYSSTIVAVIVVLLIFREFEMGCFSTTAFGAKTISIEGRNSGAALLREHRLQ